MRPVLLALALLALCAAAAAAHFEPSSPDLPGLFPAGSEERALRPATADLAANIPAPIAQNPSGKIEQVGHDPLRNRGMNAALAVHNGYAYVGYRSDGT